MTQLVPKYVWSNEAMSPRVYALLDKIMEHQEIIDKYPQGALVLNFKGCKVRAQLDKLAIDLEVADNTTDDS